jgi:hypothetical protein
LPQAQRLPDWLVYATVQKIRENNHIVKVEARLVFGTLVSLAAALVWTVLGCVSTVFIERANGADRGRNSRKVRKSYRFSKDWEVHRAMTVFTLYSANFCWAVRTLREEILPKKKYRQRTAMAAALTDHVWTLKEWLLFPGTKRYKLSPSHAVRSATRGGHHRRLRASKQSHSHCPTKVVQEIFRTFLPRCSSRTSPPASELCLAPSAAQTVSAPRN